MAGAVIEIKYFNTFVLKKTVQTNNKPIWNGSFGIPQSLGGYNVVTNTSEEENWAIEESRIRGGYNNTSVDFGVKAYLVEDEPNATNRGNSLIYSGIFNSRTGINNSNVFSVGQDITKSTDPADGSIQKLYAEDTNLIIFQERKVSRALIDKDAIYSAEGGGSVTSSRLVIGVIQPYAGRWGISKNPESFAVYGYRKYFSDKNNNVILRLSKDGITEISNYGMRDFFRDKLSSIDTTISNGFVRGGYDIYNSQYVVSTSQKPVSPNPAVGGAVGVSSLDKTISMASPSGTILAGSYITSSVSIGAKNPLLVTLVASDQLSIVVDTVPPPIISGEILTFSPVATTQQTYRTLSFDENINGWTSLYSYQPDQILSVRNKFYTIAPSRDSKGIPGGGYGIWEHYSTTVDRGNFYGVDNISSVTLVFNPEPTRSKSFKTISYEGSNGWSLSALASDNTGKDYNTVESRWINSVDIVNQVYSYVGGEYVINPADGLAVTRANYMSIFGTKQPPYPRQHAGFNRKENTYVANLVNTSQPAEGEIIFGSVMSGIKGFYTTATFRTDSTTDLGGEKQLFSVSSNYNSNNGF